MIFTPFFNHVDTQLTAYVSSTVQNVISEISPVARTMMIIYICFWGVSVMRGMISEPITDGAIRIVRLSVITGIALGTGYYSQYVSDWLWNTPNALAQAVAGADAGSNISYLDTLWDKVFNFGNAFWEKGGEQANSIGIPNIGMVLSAWAIWLVGILALTIGAMTLMISKVMLAVMLALGPIFILMAMFEPTKHFFSAWTGQIANFVILPVLTSGVIGLIFVVAEIYINAADIQLNGDYMINHLFPALMVLVCGALALLMVPSWASGLGGGIALSTLGAGGAAMRRLMGAGNSAKNMLTGKTLSDYRGQRRTKQMNAQWAQRNPGITARTTGALYNKVTNAAKFNKAA